jgi:hypothetical protein
MSAHGIASSRVQRIRANETPRPCDKDVVEIESDDESGIHHSKQVAAASNKMEEVKKLLFVTVNVSLIFGNSHNALFLSL